jgi:hypothetical protein
LQVKDNYVMTEPYVLATRYACTECEEDYWTAAPMKPSIEIKVKEDPENAQPTD